MRQSETPACDRARELLLDGRRQDEHLAVCPACGSFAARLALVDEALAAGDPAAASVPHLTSTVLRAIVENERIRLRRGIVASVAALAAGAALAFWVVGVPTGGLEPAAWAAIGGRGLQQTFEWSSSLGSPLNALQIPLGPHFTLLMAALSAMALIPLLRWLAVNS
ncbi:MAG: hypothetical protein ACE5HV_01685 [Acidobacteriota bacterium]